MKSSPVETPTAFIRAMLRAYARHGRTPEPALQHANLNRSQIEAPDARISARQMERFSDRAMRELDDEALSWFSRRLPFGTAGMLCRAGRQFGQPRARPATQPQVPSINSGRFSWRVDPYGKRSSRDPARRRCVAPADRLTIRPNLTRRGVAKILDRLAACPGRASSASSWLRECLAKTGCVQCASLWMRRQSVGHAWTSDCRSKP